MDEADVVEMEDTGPTSALPPEILTKIFTFLTLTDRKGVRLTCRLWYDCCTRVDITKHEKFVFRTDPGAEHIAAIMLRSNYSLLNLEFQGLPLRVLPANVWRECGLRIRELEFHNCQWDDETMSNIILHCENLTSLAVSKDGCIGVKRIPCSLSLLCDFIERGIQRPNLHTLYIFIQHYDDEPILRKIFLIYLRIKHLSVSTGLQMPLRLDQFLNPDTRLESLRYRDIDLLKRFSMETLVDIAERGLRLKRLEGRLIYQGSMKETIFNFFRSQRNLEVIKVHITSASEDLFYNILESCPNLREFRLGNCSRSVHLKPSEVPRFIALISKLKFLEAYFNLDDSDQVPSISNLLPDTVQLNLISLTWMRDYPVRDSDFCAAFLRRCSSLQHLYLPLCCDTTLQIIFKYLPELQTLVLCLIDDCTYDHSPEFGFSSLTVDGNEDVCSIKRLQQLRHLELLGDKVCLMRKTVLELQLPCLEYLSLRAGLYKELSEEELNHLASHLPELRVLHINASTYEEAAPLEKTIQLCKQFNNLHRLMCSILFRLREWDIQTVEFIFRACPSLKYIASDDENCSYMRDPFTGMVLRKGRLIFSKNIFDPY